MINPSTKSLFLIADVGSNWKRHSSDTKNFDLALAHIDAASLCGVSAVKFQLFTYEELYGTAGASPYALPREWLSAFAQRCHEKNVQFMCTAFSPEGIEAVDPFVNVHKLASSEMNHVLMLDKLASTGKPLLISTGGASYREVDSCRQYLEAHECYTQFGFLECVAAYPANPKDYALGASGTDFMDFIGISDHTLTDSIALAAIGLGATVFEKHFDAAPQLDATPDSETSYSPTLLRRYCDNLKAAYSAMQNTTKEVRESERDMILKHKRRLKVTRPVDAGERLRFGYNFGIYRSKEEDVIAAAPKDWPLFDGKLAKRQLQPGEGLNSACVG